MAASVSSGRISLHDAGHEPATSTKTSSSGILLKLDNDLIRDLKKASTTPNALRLTTGPSPKLRIASRTIDLSTSTDRFPNELFTSTAGTSSTDLTFAARVTHRGRLRLPAPTHEDAAESILVNTLAAHDRVKQANSTNITTGVLPIPKNRYDAVRREKLDKKKGGGVSGSTSPYLAATPNLGVAPTSTPLGDNGKLQAMKSAVVHLLAIRPAKAEHIAHETKIPRQNLDEVLQKVAKQMDGKWQLTDRAYRDLSVYKVKYRSQADRQAAIDNAVKAYDRLRLDKDDQLWQLLLPKSERDKGKVLSKLHLGGSSQIKQGLTPLPQASPLHHSDGAGEMKVASTATTPKLGASTPRPNSSKGGDVMKRLLSKNPQKARAAEEAKEKTRKDREAAASDREGAKAAKSSGSKKTNPNIKSAEFVYSSDEEDDEPASKVKGSGAGTKETSKPTPKPTSKPVNPKSSSDSSDTPLKRKREPQTGTVNTKSDGKPSTADPRSPPAKVARLAKADEHTTPKRPNTNGLSAPSSQHKDQRSPQLANSRPSVPSPLGAARPRVASDVSDRSALGMRNVRPGGDTPKGLGITTEAPRKRHDTVTGAETAASSKAEKARPSAKQTSPEKPHSTPKVNGTGAAGTAKATKSNGVPTSESGTKRKADEPLPSEQQSNKHRRTESTKSAPSPHLRPSDGNANNTTSKSKSATPNNTTPAHPSPRPALLDSTKTPNITTTAPAPADAVVDMTYTQGVNQADKFRSYYPAYAALHADLKARQDRGEKIDPAELATLVQMHNRLDGMKKEIREAAKRE